MSKNCAVIDRMETGTQRPNNEVLTQRTGATHNHKIRKQENSTFIEDFTPNSVVFAPNI